MTPKPLKQCGSVTPKPIPSHAQVFKVEFFMRNFLSPTMKPTMIISNTSFFGELDKGPVSKQRKRRAKTTTKRYQDKGGRVRFCGTPALKSSQRLVYNTSMLYDYLAMISFGNSSWTFLNSFWNYPNVRLFLVEIDQ